MKRHVVVLQHGSHGTRSDLSYLAQHLRAINPSIIIFEPRMNEGFKTSRGIVSCGASFAFEVQQLLDSFCPSSPNAALPGGPQGSCDFGRAGAVGDVTVQLSFVAHSMGGLIVREALPRLFRAVGRGRGPLRVEWRAFCSIATPHGGTCGMDAFIRSYLGRIMGRLFYTSYHDMFLQSNILTERLLSPEHLACLAAFDRRVLVSSVNDLLVPLMSSGFMLTFQQRDEKDATTNKVNEAAMCAHNEDEMYTKQRRIFGLCEKEWPIEVCPVERRIVESILRGAGPVDSIVIDFRPLVEKCDNQFARHVAYKLSHRALVCKDPIMKMGVENIFGFVSAAVARIVAACHC